MPELTRYIEAINLLKSGLEDWQGECQCVNPPGDRDDDDAVEMGNDPDNPAHHAMYCPVFLMGVISALENEEEFPI